MTTKDVETAGPDVETLKGKSVRKKSHVVNNDLIEIPPEILEQHQDLVLPFLSSLSSSKLNIVDNKH